MYLRRTVHGFSPFCFRRMVGLPTSEDGAARTILTPCRAGNSMTPWRGGNPLRSGILDLERP